MSILLDTDLLSLLERKRIPAKLAAWIAEQNDLVVSVVSLAELEFGLQQAPVAHRPALASWLAETRRSFAPAIEELTEPILGSLEGTPCRSQEKKADDDVGGFVDSRYSLVSWS